MEFGQPPKVEILDSWNLLEDEIDALVRKFETVSYKSLKRDGLNKLWKRVKVLAPGSLLASVVRENTLRTIRSNLRKDTGILVDNEEVYIGISKLLNEAAVVAMSSIAMPKPARRVGKREIKREGNQIEEVIPRDEKEEIASDQKEVKKEDTS